MKTYDVCPHCRQRDGLREHIHPSDKRAVQVCVRCAKVLADERKESR